MNDMTRREIEKCTWQMLRDACITKPPVQIEDVLKHLQLFRDFYDLQSPGFLDRAKHKLQINGMKLVNVIKRVKLQAVLLFDENRIVVDSGLPKIKVDWPSFHEASHRILRWHHPYFYGDTAQTLNPDWQQVLEAEANFAASAMMFCGPVFTDEARDTSPQWNSVDALKRRYGKSFQTTVRRYVEHGPDCVMAVLVSTPYWEQTPPDQEGRCRRLVGSPLFRAMFGKTLADALRSIVDTNTAQRRGGPVGDFSCVLVDDNGKKHEFRGEAFFNRFYITTLFVHLKELTKTRNVGVA